MASFDGKCNIDRVEIAELHIEPAVPGNWWIKKASAKYVLSNSKTENISFGSGTYFQWGDAVKEKLQELLVLMEQEIGSKIFEKSETTITSVEEEAPTLDDGVPGL